MVEFLTTKQALGAIEHVIDAARERLVLLSPYQRISEMLRARIAAAAQRGVEIDIVYGPQDGGVNEILAMGSFPNTRVFYCPTLHAKCYFNDEVMVITSLNLLVTSENNWEMGVRLGADEPAYRSGVREAELIISSSELQMPRNSGTASRFAELRPARRSTAHCIRCRTLVQFNWSRPLCADCFAVWRQWENWDYVELWCHECGEREGTTFAKPLCDACFRDS